MVRGFKLLDDEFGIVVGRGAPFSIGQVCFGFEPYRGLRISVDDGDMSGEIVFDDPVSHRVQDERDMLHYWSARSGEGGAVGRLYSVAESAYLAELSGGVSSFERDLRHYLVLGDDICVEVIAYQPPQLTIRDTRSGT